MGRSNCNRSRATKAGTTTAVAGAVAEMLEGRRLLSVTWAIDSNRALQISTDDNNSSIKLSTVDQVTLLLTDQSQPVEVNYPIPMDSFDRINVQMGAAQINYFTWVDGESTSAHLDKPANVDVGGGAGAQNIIFFYARTARLSGDGLTGGQYTNGSDQASAVNFKDAQSTQVIGGNVFDPCDFDCSAFTGNGLSLDGTYANDTLIGGSGDTGFFPSDGNDIVRTIGGNNTVYANGSAGSKTVYGCPTHTSVEGGAGDITFYDGGGSDVIAGGSGNNTYYGYGTGGPDSIAVGSIQGAPGYTGIVFNHSRHLAELSQVHNILIDAGGGVDDGIIPAAVDPNMTIPIAGPVDPSINLQITHLEPTVDAGADTTLSGSGAFTGSGSFRDIGDPTNAWTATADYGDGTGQLPISIDPSTISTANGPAHAFSLNHNYVAAGTYTVTITVTDGEGDIGSATRTVIVINPVSQSSVEGMVWVDFNNDGNVDFGEQGIAGVPITLIGSAGNVVAQTTTDANGLYTFNHVSPDLYSISEGRAGAEYVEGKDTLGNITDLQGNVISASAGNASVQDLFSAIPLGADQNAINYNFGEQPAAGSAVSKGQAATMGFWQNKNGQALILKFSSIGSWLADTMPQTFGGLAGASAQQVATLYQQQFVLKDKLDAQVMATALNVYATDSSLGGSSAASYGFTVGTYGLGDSTWNIGADGAAFNVADNSTLTVMQILQDWDQQSNKASTSLRKLAIDVFGGINAKGGI